MRTVILPVALLCSIVLGCHQRAPTLPNDPRFQQYLWRPFSLTSGGQVSAERSSVTPVLPPYDAAQPPNKQAVQQTARGAEHPNSFALVVGIESYRGLSSPVGAVRDAEAFRQMAQRSFGIPNANIRVLLDDRATRSSIEKELDWVASNVRGQGDVIFYFAGHGSADRSDKDDQPAQYLLPWDAEADDVHSTAVELGSMLDKLRGSRAKHVVAFLDACYSGGGGRGIAPKTRAVVREREAPDRTAVFSAAAVNQVAGPTASGTGGAFTSTVIMAMTSGADSALADNDGDGDVTLRELADFVTDRVENQSRRVNRKQRPHLSTAADAKPEDIQLGTGLTQ